MKKIVWLIGFALMNVGCLGCTRIGPGYVGIVVNMAGSNRGVQNLPAKTGWVFYNPFSESVIEYPTFVQSVVWTHDKSEGAPANEEITFTNADDMSIAVDVALSYSIQPDSVPAFYVKFHVEDLTKFTYGYLHSLARDKFNAEAGSYHIEQIMGDNKAFLDSVKASLQQDLTPYGVQLEAQFGIIGAPRPPDAVITSINNKVQAMQIAQQKENELAQSKADANKEVAQAEGHARAVLARADAEAQSNRKIADSITTNLIEMRKIQQWDGHLPTVQGGGGGILMQLPGSK